MHSLRRSVLRTPQKSQSILPASTLQQVPRRFASEQHDHSHHEHAHAHAGPTTESFGKSFYIGLALIPSCYLLYTFSQDSAASPLASLIETYASYSKTWEERNALHTKAVEAAGHDRLLFHQTPGLVYRELEMPEKFGEHIGINVPAGGVANMDKLVEHYKQKNFKEQEEKLQRLKEGRIPGQGVYKEIGPTK